MTILHRIFWMIVLALGLNAALTLPLIAQEFVCDGKFFIIMHATGGIDAGSGTNLYKLDYRSGNIDYNQPIVYADIKLNGIGFNPKDQFIYGISPVSFRNDQHRIVRLYNDGSYQVLEFDEGDINDVKWYYAATDFSPDGYLVVHDRGSQQLHYLDVSGDKVKLHTSVALRWAPEVSTDGFFVAITDLAFDITEPGVIYTHQRSYQHYGRENETTRGALLKINGDLASPEVGTVTVVGTVDNSIIAHLGSLFFNPFGDLYGYGSVEPKGTGNFAQDRLIAIDKTGGSAMLLSEGPTAGSTDGCSCRSSLALQVVAQTTTDPCQNLITYRFTIANNTLEDVSGITFTDTLPEGLIIQAIDLPPAISYEVDTETGVGFNLLTLNELTLPASQQVAFTVQAKHSGISGTYAHQAYLMNLPDALGSTVVSDDKTTPEPNDPTQITIIQEHPSPQLVADTTICPDEPFPLTTKRQIVQPFYWTGPDDYYSSEDQPEATLPARYDSAYYYLHRQVENCEIIDSVLVKTLPLPSVSLIADTTISSGSSVELAPNSVASSLLTYRWTPAEGLSCTDCINPVATPTESTTYQLAIENQLGCTQSASVSVEVVKNEFAARRVSIPNAFSPNGDGMNDVFFPVAQPGVECQKLEIFNRWGELIFRQVNFPPNEEEYGWSGLHQGRKLNAGTYTYQLVAEDQEGKQQTYSGRIHLIR